MIASVRQFYMGFSRFSVLNSFATSETETENTIKREAFGKWESYAFRCNKERYVGTMNHGSAIIISHLIMALMLTKGSTEGCW